MDHILINVNNGDGIFLKVNIDPKRRRRDATFLFTLAGEFVEVTDDPYEAEKRLGKLDPQQRANLDRAYRAAFSRPFDWEEYRLNPPNQVQPPKSRIELEPGEPEISLVRDDLYKISPPDSLAFVISNGSISLVTYKSVAVGFARAGCQVVWSGLKNDRVGVIARDGSLDEEHCRSAFTGRPGIVDAFIAAYGEVFGTERAQQARCLIMKVVGTSPKP